MRKISVTLINMTQGWGQNFTILGNEFSHDTKLRVRDKRDFVSYKQFSYFKFRLAMWELYSIFERMVGGAWGSSGAWPCSDLPRRVAVACRSAPRILDRYAFPLCSCCILSPALMRVAALDLMRYRLICDVMRGNKINNRAR